MQYWPSGVLPVTVEIMVTITHFYDSSALFYKSRRLDVDNIPKPVLDTLKGLIFQDDVQVTDLLCRKRDIQGNLLIMNPSNILDAGLRRGKDFLFVLLEEAPDQEVIE